MISHKINERNYFNRKTNKSGRDNCYKNVIIYFISACFFCFFFFCHITKSVERITSLGGPAFLRFHARRRTGASTHELYQESAKDEDRQKYGAVH